MDELITINKNYLMHRLDEELKKDIFFEMGRAGSEDGINQIFQHATGIIDALDLMSLAAEGIAGDEAHREIQQYIKEMRITLARKDGEEKRKVRFA